MRKRKASYDELKEELQRSQIEATRLMQALDAITNGRFKKLGRYFEDGGGEYVWACADLTRGHSGLLSRLWRPSQSAPWAFHVWYLDDAARHALGLPDRDGMKDAVHKARLLQTTQHIDEAREARS